MARHTRTARLTAAGLGAAVVLTVVTGCGAAKTSPSGMMTMRDGTVMSSSQMSGMASSPAASGTPNPMPLTAGSGPSATAKMVCSDEVAGAVVRSLTVRTAPPRHSAWANRTFTCTYVLAGGSLRLSVKDLTSLRAGQAWFAGLRKQLRSPSTIHGMSNLGFPAFQTPDGDVAFLKDGKVLLVDASNVSAALIPPGSTRTGVAYGVAAAVIACWKE